MNVIHTNLPRQSRVGLRKVSLKVFVDMNVVYETN